MSNIVNIVNEKKYNLEQLPNLATKILNQTLKTINNKNNSEIALIFVNENESLNLNRQYRKKNYIADVLSFSNQMDIFDNNEDTIDLGDVFICYPKAVIQAKEYNHSLTRELCFLFLHGLLHNLGYDHISQEEETIMFNLQDTILNELKIFRTNEDL